MASENQAEETTYCPEPPNATPPPSPAPLLPIPHSLLPDFSRRNFPLRELLDEPLTFADYAAAMRSLTRINNLTRAHVPTLRFLEQLVARHGVRHQPLHIVDLGCAHGDLLRRIHRWATKRSLPIRLTGIDLNPYATRLAPQLDREERLPAKAIHWQTADFLSTVIPSVAEGSQHFTATSEPIQPGIAAPDVFLCHLTAHHLADDQVVKLLQLSATARLGFQITDLRRSQRAAKIFTLLAHLSRLHPMITHDGIVSFQRAFSLEEWRGLVDQAGVSAQVTDLGMGRLGMEGLPPDFCAKS